jgi:hypothetical protein
MIVYSGKGQQLNYDGYSPNDLQALARFSLLTSTPSGQGHDVIVLPGAFAYRPEISRPNWRRISARTFGVTGQGARYLLAIVLTIIVTEVARDLIGPLVKRLFGPGP